MQIQFSLIKKKQRLDTQNPRPPPPPTLPTSNNILFLPYSPTPLSQSGSHMCITPDLNMQNSVKLKFELKFGT